MPILYALTILFWLWMILDFFLNDTIAEDIWSIVVFFTAIGAVIYFFAFFVPRVQHASGGVRSRRRFKELLAFGEDHLPAGQLRELGDMYHDRGSWADALRCYQKAAPILPDQFSLSLDMADCLIALKRAPEAVEPLRDVVQRAPHYRERACLSLTYCLEESGRWMEALAEIEPVSRSTRSQHVKYCYAECLIRNGRAQEAKAVLDDIVRSAPLAPKEQRPWSAKAKKLLKQMNRDRSAKENRGRV